MPLARGFRLGPYEIVSPLGAGGMGEVDRARDTRLDRTVALKTLPDALAADSQFRDRFEREARTISQLSHPHICPLFDVGDQDGGHFLVMEYLEGETLAERLGRFQDRPLPLADALMIAVEIAAALDAAHRRGIVHRDLKPGNVMLTKTGAKLLDFGLAKTRAGWTGRAGAAAFRRADGAEESLHRGRNAHYAVCESCAWTRRNMETRQHHRVRDGQCGNWDRVGGRVMVGGRSGRRTDATDPSRQHTG